MTLSHSTHPSETACIPLPRFATHVLLSALAVTIPQLLQYFGGAYLKDSIAVLSWSATNTCNLMMHTISSCCNLHDINTTYSVAASNLIASLYIITKLLGRCVDDSDSGFIMRQHIAVHFCLAFCVITELEFYRAYADFKKLDMYSDFWKSFLHANVDPSFLYFCESLCYMASLPNSWQRCLDSLSDKRTFWASPFSKPSNVSYASCLIFHVLNGLANYLVKLIVNSGSGHDFFSAMIDGLVLFGSSPASVWELLLGLALLRVVR